MSLLLDALNKKSGDKSQGTGLSNLTLEDAPAPRAAAASTSSSASASSRSAGETMFAAKKKKPAGRSWKLGLVPTTLLIALVFGSGYGYYVWLQISPASQPKLVQRAAPRQRRPWQQQRPHRSRSPRRHWFRSFRHRRRRRRPSPISRWLQLATRNSMRRATNRKSAPLQQARDK